MSIADYYQKNRAAFKSSKASPKALLAQLISSCFSFISTLRSKAYEKGFLKSIKAKIPVVSIGNISIGGSGKTPFCILLANALQEKGIRFGFISKGYKGQMSKKLSKQEFLTVCASHGPMIPANSCGDEPYLIASKFPQHPFVVSPNRVLAANKARLLGAELVLMDDGFQHRRLVRDLDIVLVRAQDPLEGAAFFPRGGLRDSLGRLAEADYVVVTGCDKVSFAYSKKCLAPYTQAPLIGVQSTFSKATLFNGKSFDLKGKRVIAFAGIAHPEAFFKMLEEAGANVVLSAELLDHAKIEDDFLYELELKVSSLGAEAIVCTEKDWVKLQHKNKSSILAYVSMEHELLCGKSTFKELLSQIQSLL